MAMWSDNETDIDLLGFSHLRTAVMSLATDDTLLPATIGVYGDWGSGKTSLMKMVCADLEKDPTTLVLWFNGWLFEGFDDAKTALMGNIIDAIIAKRSMWTKSKDKAGKLALKLLKKLPVFRALNIGSRAVAGYMAAGNVGAVASLAVDGTAIVAEATQAFKTASESLDKLTPEQVADALKTEDDHNVRRSIREFHKDFAALLEETGIQRLVVCIDDLDRCIPDTIIETLEAIKLFLFAPKTAFIIGADERLVQYAVRRRFPELPGERVDVGQDYLEKLVQFAVRVPPLGRAEMETYINLLFCRKAATTPESFEEARKKAIETKRDGLAAVRFNRAEAQALLGKVPDELVESLTMSQRIAPFFAAQLTGNPRQCKRFLNQLFLRMAMAESRGIELKQRVLAKLMLLERFRNISFRHLAEAQASQDGKPAELRDAERAIARPEETQDAKKKPGSTRSIKREEPVEVAEWLRDAWIQKDWLTQEPILTGIDLAPYFYFSRDKLGALSGAAQRLSQAAQDSLAHLFDESDTVRELALKHAPNLSAGDASAVFDAIAQKLREEEDSSGDESALSILCEFVKVRPELLNQFLLVVGYQAATTLPVWLPQRIKQLSSGTEEANTAHTLFSKWHEQLQPGALKTAIAQQMK
jgi:predicted KAP-like P-loop ATPase